MADLSQILHRFVSSVPDDPTIPEAVRPQKDWNDTHVISGGNDGEVFVVDSSATDGFSFKPVSDIITGRLEHIVQNTGSFVGNGGTGVLGPAVLTLTKTSSVFIFSEGRIADTSGFVTNCTFFVFINAAISNQYFLQNTLQPILFLNYVLLAPGVYSIGGGFNANVNPITSCFVKTTVLAFG
jgi:hypothetical protein